jgi:hypothetical protein
LIGTTNTAPAAGANGTANGAKDGDKKKGNEKGKDAKDKAAIEIPTIEDDEQEEKDPLQPDIDLDDVVDILQDFN